MFFTVIPYLHPQFISATSDSPVSGQDQIVLRLCSVK